LTTRRYQTKEDYEKQRERTSMSMNESVLFQPILCTIPQAAAMIGRGQTFIYGAIGDGRLEAVKSDKRTLIVVKSLYKYAAELPPAKIKPLPKRKHHHRRTR
jgi:hypothetical protein